MIKKTVSKRGDEPSGLGDTLRTAAFQGDIDSGHIGADGKLPAFVDFFLFSAIDVHDLPAALAIKVPMILKVGTIPRRVTVDIDLLDQPTVAQRLKHIINRRQ